MGGPGSLHGLQIGTTSVVYTVNCLVTAMTAYAIHLSSVVVVFDIGGRLTRRSAWAELVTSPRSFLHPRAGLAGGYRVSARSYPDYEVGWVFQACRRQARGLERRPPFAPLTLDHRRTGAGQNGSPEWTLWT